MAIKIRIKGASKKFSGHSSSINPATKRFRNSVEKIESELKSTHLSEYGDSSNDDAISYKTDVSTWTNCSNITFSKLIDKNNLIHTVLHREILSVLGTVTDIIRQKNGNETDLEYFALLMTTLSSSHFSNLAVDNLQEITLTATVFLINVVIKRVPTSLVVAKCSIFIQAILNSFLMFQACLTKNKDKLDADKNTFNNESSSGTNLTFHKDHGPYLFYTCAFFILAHIIRHQPEISLVELSDDTNALSNIHKAFDLLLTYSIDEHSKIRKSAKKALERIFEFTNESSNELENAINAVEKSLSKQALIQRLSLFYGTVIAENLKSIDFTAYNQAMRTLRKRKHSAPKNEYMNKHKHFIRKIQQSLKAYMEFCGQFATKYGIVKEHNLIECMIGKGLEWTLKIYNAPLESDLKLKISTLQTLSTFFKTLFENYKREKSPVLEEKIEPLSGKYGYLNEEMCAKTLATLYNLFPNNPEIRERSSIIDFSLNESNNDQSSPQSNVDDVTLYKTWISALLYGVSYFSRINSQLARSHVCRVQTIFLHYTLHWFSAFSTCSFKTNVNSMPIDTTHSFITDKKKKRVRFNEITTEKSLKNGKNSLKTHVKIAGNSSLELVNDFVTEHISQVFALLTLVLDEGRVSNKEKNCTLNTYNECDDNLTSFTPLYMLNSSLTLINESICQIFSLQLSKTYNVSPCHEQNHNNNIILNDMIETKSHLLGYVFKILLPNYLKAISLYCYNQFVNDTVPTKFPTCLMALFRLLAWLKDFLATNNINGEAKIDNYNITTNNEENKVKGLLNIESLHHLEKVINGNLKALLSIFGPHIFLQYIPHHIDPYGLRFDLTRSWIFPLLMDCLNGRNNHFLPSSTNFHSPTHYRWNTIETFRTQLYPLACSLRQKAFELSSLKTPSNSTNNSLKEAKTGKTTNLSLEMATNMHTLSLQIWSLLPCFMAYDMCFINDNYTQNSSSLFKNGLSGENFTFLSHLAQHYLQPINFLTPHVTSNDNTIICSNNTNSHLQQKFMYQESEDLPLIILRTFKAFFTQLIPVKNDNSMMIKTAQCGDLFQQIVPALFNIYIALETTILKGKNKSINSSAGISIFHNNNLAPAKNCVLETLKIALSVSTLGLLTHLIAKVWEKVNYTNSIFLQHNDNKSNNEQNSVWALNEGINENIAKIPSWLDIACLIMPHLKFSLEKVEKMPSTVITQLHTNLLLYALDKITRNIKDDLYHTIINHNMTLAKSIQKRCFKYLEQWMINLTTNCMQITDVKEKHEIANFSNAYYQEIMNALENYCKTNNLDFDFCSTKSTRNEKNAIENFKTHYDRLLRRITNILCKTWHLTFKPCFGVRFKCLHYMLYNNNDNNIKDSEISVQSKMEITTQENIEMENIQKSYNTERCQILAGLIPEAILTCYGKDISSKARTMALEFVGNLLEFQTSPFAIQQKQQQQNEFADKNTNNICFTSYDTFLKTVLCDRINAYIVAKNCGWTFSQKNYFKRASKDDKIVKNGLNIEMETNNEMENNEEESIEKESNVVFDRPLENENQVIACLTVLSYFYLNVGSKLLEEIKYQILTGIVNCIGHVGEIAQLFQKTKHKTNKKNTNINVKLLLKHLLTFLVETFKSTPLTMAIMLAPSFIQNISKVPKFLRISLQFKIKIILTKLFRRIDTEYLDGIMSKELTLVYEGIKKVERRKKKQQKNKLLLNTTPGENLTESNQDSDSMLKHGKRKLRDNSHYEQCLVEKTDVFDEDSEQICDLLDTQSLSGKIVNLRKTASKNNGILGINQNDTVKKSTFPTSEDGRMIIDNKNNNDYLTKKSVVKSILKHTVNKNVSPHLEKQFKDLKNAYHEQQQDFDPILAKVATDEDTDETDNDYDEEFNEKNQIHTSDMLTNSYSTIKNKTLLRSKDSKEAKKQQNTDAKYAYIPLDRKILSKRRQTLKQASRLKGIVRSKKRV